MRLFAERKIRVPKDISIVGIDNINVARYLPVSLTSVAVPVNEMGDIATKILLRKVHDPGYKLVQQVMLRPRLMVRESTCSARPV
jgi:LacI family transcriptional regulator